ncbi:cell division protein CrgA [Aeromicrobium sp.]|uniref:cell division protein CrgA n=1 Tax=Aeromicrobium sp. TaxID=1871063 RepID=UPI003D69FEA1
MAKNVPHKSPRQEPPPSTRGGWKHPLALVLLVGAVAWFVATIFATTDKDFPAIGEIPVFFGIGKWNYAIAAGLGFAAMSVADRTRPAPRPGEPGKVANRWAAPAMVASAVVGLLWIVVFYVVSGTDTRIPFYSDLGQWNIVIGMGFILAAFGFAMKWE